MVMILITVWRMSSLAPSAKLALILRKMDCVGLGSVMTFSQVACARNAATTIS